MSQTGFQKVTERAALIRLTALWALHEAAIAGILHFLKIPFSGLFMAGGAIVLICLIAYVAKNPFQEILKAMMVVLIIKLTLSPHAPITAYIAVCFQGLLGAILFGLFPYKLSAMLLGIIGMMETALQKLLTLTLLFGKSLWSSIDLFIESVMQRLGYEGNEAYSLRVVIFYLSVYAVGGIIIGILASRLPRKVEQKIMDADADKLNREKHELEAKKKKKKKKLFVPWFIVGAMSMMIAVYYLVPDLPRLFHPLFLVARVILVIFLWYLVLSPILMSLLKKFLKSRESEYTQDVNAALGLLPSFRSLIKKAWDETSGIRGPRRYSEFLGTAIAYCLLYNHEA